MTPSTLLASLRSAGFTVRLGEGAHAGRLIVNPGDKLTTEQVAAVREHKADLLALLIEEAADSADGEAIIDAIAGRAVADDPFRRALPGRQPAASADGAPALAGRAADGVQRGSAGQSGVAEAPPAVGYVAWLRAIGGDEYEPVRFHSDRDRCMALLREQMAVEGGHCEGMVLPAGQNPNRRRRPR